MTDDLTNLRDQIAEALYQWTLTAAGGRRLIPADEASLRENSRARADVVMTVLADHGHTDQHAAVTCDRRTPEPEPADWFGITATLPGTHSSACWRWHPACAYRRGVREAEAERDALNSAIERVRRLAQVWVDVRPTRPAATRMGHVMADAGEQILDLLDQPAPAEHAPTEETPDGR